MPRNNFPTLRDRSGRRTKLPEQFLPEDIYHARERHTQKRFVPAAMNLSLVMESRWKPSQQVTTLHGGRVRRRSPSTLQLNNSNVKRKATARGRGK
jgi:hypothetical protein